MCRAFLARKWQNGMFSFRMLNYNTFVFKSLTNQTQSLLCIKETQKVKGNTATRNFLRKQLVNVDIEMYR